ncbi:VgrG-related protein [Lyngbya sp. CCY1209]|uniref:VgrG-related protein n=1 Tax=Lyngbya sp. CCY1209 TaxID=2886103 RepID=UPI002D1FE77D|nr:VgrG-related protein [Lyngbya sp. CCY1209]MEB3884691.1 VgrG-related protein [Lyngbya sp. CCY1209]
MASDRSLYVSSPLLQIEGASSSSLSALINDLIQISVEESLHLPGMFTLVINNPFVPVDDESETWQHDPLLQIGKKVKIGFQGSTTDSPEFDRDRQDYIIEGEITAIETHFTSDTRAPIVVRGYDISHRLHRGRYNRSFQDYTDSDIVAKIAREVGIDRGTIDPSEEKKAYIFQENQTNMEFLRERAARIGFELFVQDGKLFFRKPRAGDILKLKWLTDFETFRVRVTSAEQVKSVEVHGWDYHRKQPIVSVADRDETITRVEGNSPRPSPNGGFTAPNFGSNCPPPKLIVVDKPVSSPKEADRMAQALYDELGGEFIQADSQAPGNPQIRVGKVVELTDMGRYGGRYYITETRHLYQEGRYTTEFAVRGLRGGSIFHTLSPQTALKPGQTHLVGIVTHNDDPEGLGRVRVKFPTLTPEPDGSAHASAWARVVGVGAGPDRGFYCLPEINDEVLVAFEHGDIHRPYVIGGVWNGQDKPPDGVEETISRTGKVRLRSFATPAGHQIQFVEEDRNRQSQEGVYIRTGGGHEIRLNDSDRSIEIATSGGQRIRIDDRTGKIDILTPNVGVTGTLTAAALVVGGAGGTNVADAIANLGAQVQQQRQDFQNYVNTQAAIDRQQNQTAAALNNQLRNQQRRFENVLEQQQDLDERQDRATQELQRQLREAQEQAMEMRDR